MAQDYVQLIFSNNETDQVILPYTSLDKYQCYSEEIGSKLEMISGRIVTERRGHVQKIQYSYDCMGNTLWRSVASFLRSGRAFTVQYRSDDSDELITSQFICESLTPPKFAFYQDDTAYWHNIEFTLREVSPHD